MLHFDNNGKFVSALNKQGQGPEEYPRIEDFDVYKTDYLTKVQGRQHISTEFSYGTTLSCISDTESDNSLLLYITPDRLSEYGKEVSDKFGNTITGDMEDNPYILEFFE
ncbi:6-bladed beta-propeller [Parabacteroides sp.]